MKPEAQELAEFLEQYICSSGGQIYVLLPDSDLEEIGADCLIATHETFDSKTVGRAVLQKILTSLHKRARFDSIYATLHRSDRAVLSYLDMLRRRGDGETCTASFPNIARACDISERQAQYCIKRLIAAELVTRTCYDFGNRDRSKRGTIYKLLFTNRFPYSPRISNPDAPSTTLAQMSGKRRPSKRAANMSAEGRAPARVEP